MRTGYLALDYIALALGLIAITLLSFERVGRGLF